MTASAPDPPADLGRSLLAISRDARSTESLSEVFAALDPAVLRTVAATAADLLAAEHAGRGGRPAVDDAASVARIQAEMRRGVNRGKAIGSEARRRADGDELSPDSHRRRLAGKVQKVGNNV